MVNIRGCCALLVVLQLRPFDLVGQARAHPNPDSVMQVGLAILERARAEDGRKFDRARNIFREAHRLAPDRAEPLLGIGLAEGGKGDWLAAEPLNIGTRVGHGAYRAAVHALAQALDRDPNLTSAVTEMDRVTTALRDTAIEQQVLLTIRKAVASGNDNPEILLILGRRERAAGHTEASIAVLERYQSSGSEALARYEIARSYLSANDEAGVRLYFDAVSSADSMVIGEIRADLVPIAEPHELEEFDATDGTALLGFLRRFWEDRARRDLRSPGERIREHYRRLHYARRHFVLSNNRRYYSLRDLYRASKSENLDDRGVVYVRHGEPDQRIRPLLFGLLPNETWVYHRADGDLLLHFSAGGEGMEGGDLTDYRLVPSLFDLRGDRTPKDLLIASRFEVSDLYQKIMAWGPIGARRMMREERIWGQTSAAIGTREEGFELEFARSLETSADLVAIGRRNGNALVQVVYALRGIEPGVPVRLRLVLFDSLGVVHAWLDSTANSQPMGGEGSGGRFELSVPAGPWTYRLAIEAGTAGVVTPRTPIVVPALDQGRLAISDIAMGQHAGNLEWSVTPTDIALVSPHRDFPAGGELRLYYEVYGLEPDVPYSATINVLEKRRERSGRNRLSFNFQEEGDPAITRIRRSVVLAGLPKGEYWLEVVVKDRNGRQVTTRKAFSVTPVTH